MASHSRILRHDGRSFICRGNHAIWASNTIRCRMRSPSRHRNPSRRCHAGTRSQLFLCQRQPVASIDAFQATGVGRNNKASHDINGSLTCNTCMRPLCYGCLLTYGPCTRNMVHAQPPTSIWGNAGASLTNQLVQQLRPRKRRGAIPSVVAGGGLVEAAAIKLNV